MIADIIDTYICLLSCLRAKTRMPLEDIFPENAEDQIQKEMDWILENKEYIVWLVNHKQELLRSKLCLDVLGHL